MTITNILKASRTYIKKLHLHTMTVYYWGQVVKPNGSKTEELLPKEGYTNIPCRISFSKLNYDDPTSTTPTTNPIKSKPKVFCDIDKPIKAGDIVWVTVGSKIYKGKASDDCVYDGNHIEFTLGIEEKA